MPVPSHPSLTREGCRALLALALAGCARSGPVVVTSTPSTAAGADASPGTSRGSVGATPASVATMGWRIDAREHVDLWLHGFAMLQADSSLVPSYRLDYHDRVARARRAASASTLLDANALLLTRRLRENPALTSAHFVALYFASWDDLRRGCQRFLRANGNVRAAADQESLRMFATLATYFPTAADREWLRLYLEALDDERARFFRNWWTQEQAARATARGTIEAQWRGSVGPAIGRFLHGSGQREGRILLSLALGGEGRTLDVGQHDNFVTVTFPGPADDPREAFYGIAHEVVGTVSNAVVRDHTTPNDQQRGETGRLSTLAAVRGGATLLDRVAPDLADGYRRWYLVGARQVPGADVKRQFEAVYPLPPQILAALERQVDLVLNGI